MENSRRTAIVTGAARPWGLGRCTAMALADKGLDIAVVDIRDDWGEEAARAIRKEKECGAIYVKTDLRKRGDIEAMVARVIREFGRVDVLANVAGILHIAPFLEVSRYDWDRVVAVNLTGVFFLSQAVARIMVDQQAPGRIVNVSSVHAVVSEPNAAPYTATKGGLEAMTRTMASELASYGITVNCVRPGATMTRMSEPIYTAQIVRSLMAKIPLGKIAPPEWVASAICYLASDEACYTTGACLDVDGGYAMDGSLPGTAYA